MKKIIVGLGLGAVLLLGACEEYSLEKTSADHLGSQIEEKGYINDTGKSDMYVEVYTMVSLTEELALKATALIKSNPTASELSEAGDYFLEVSNQLDRMEFNAVTEYDLEMENSARMYRINVQMLLKTLVKYTQTQDKSTLRLVKSYTEDIKVYNKDVERIAVKYNLQ